MKYTIISKKDLASHDNKKAIVKFRKIDQEVEWVIGYDWREVFFSCSPEQEIHLLLIKELDIADTVIWCHHDSFVLYYEQDEDDIVTNFVFTEIEILD